MQWEQTLAQLTILQKEGKTQEGIALTRQQLPLLLQVAQNTNQNDSLIRQINNLLRLCHYFYQKPEYVKEGVLYLDSLNQNPFLKKYCQHELLSCRASLHQFIGENQEAVRLADKYLRLPPNPDASSFLRQAEGISGVYVYSGNDLPKAISLLEKAVDAYRKGAKYSNMTLLMSRLGVYYRLTGEYEKAIAINQEAIANYNDSIHPRNVVIAYGEQANLYADLGMYDHALQMNRKAQYYSMLKDSFGLGDVYRYRALIFREIGNKDSTWYYLNIAEKISALQMSYKGVFINRVLKAEVYLDDPDSTQKALQIALSVCPDSTRVPQWAKYQLDLQLGSALLKTGQEEKGIPLIEKAAQRLTDMDMPEGHIGAKTLMNYYLKKGMNDAFVRSYILNHKMADSLQDVEKVRAVAAANIRFDTQQKEKENKLLSAQVNLQQQQLFYNICISIVLLLLLITFIAYFINRRKAHRLLIENNKREIQKLITRQQDLNRRNEQLTEQIEQAMASNNINTIRQLTGQNLLSKEDENEFRQSFATIYPSYLPNLREHYPQLTRNEELLAMLICMNQSTDEIALIMGINRNSVNVVRSRMRKNMELAKEESLDEVIKQYLP
ncbi:tetratricopeptide repeat protein [Bacteroides sp.]|uniref:tetratricopeptide repeat protein n=1 Tax=Bacteroides sp. TaxID=29523 RepID=UPI00260DF7B6|nr:tetratricopeptide repeat protein [Bacteroides sp.]